MWYGSLTGLVVLVVSLLTYSLHTRAHYDDVDRRLRNVAEHLVTAATTPDEVAELLRIPVVPGVAVQVYGSDGQVLMSGAHAALLPTVDPQEIVAQPSRPAVDPLVGLAPPLMAIGPSRGTYGLVRGPDASRWRVYVVTQDGPVRYVMATSPLDALDASIERFRLLIVLFTLVGAALTLIAGLLLASGALRPVATLTGTAGTIARSRDFKRRVPVADRRDELGRLALTFNEMLDSLEQAYRAQQRFVADASHELRAPLTAMQANVELLERQPDMPPAERQEAVREIGREARRLARLVADLLALARADAGLPIRRQRVELDRMLLEALAEARHLARGQRIEIEHLELALVEGDPDRLKQLFLIVLDNALKYTPPSGTVTLGLRRYDATAEVTVRDTGIGIAPEHLPHVFERFYRADPARARDPGGTGLGLPIARWIVEQHHGEISLSSAPGRGTTAVVRLSVSTSAPVS
ncbi:MAG: HAMP domain-containing protein [Chloroflexi bacterium]|nr:HAMP domain-containing protein [Chloroflexota bacterium]